MLCLHKTRRNIFQNSITYYIYISSHELHVVNIWKVSIYTVLYLISLVGVDDWLTVIIWPQDPDVQPYLTLCQNDTLIYGSFLMNGAYVHDTLALNWYKVGKTAPQLSYLYNKGITAQNLPYPFKNFLETFKILIRHFFLPQTWWQFIQIRFR